MRKISGILPSSPRVTTVDLKNSGAVRPGMPTFGRVKGSSSLAQGGKAYMTSFTSDVTGDPMLGRRNLSYQEQRAKIVSDVSNGFFMKKAQQFSQIDTPRGGAGMELVREPDKLVVDATELKSVNSEALYSSGTVAEARSSNGVDQAARVDKSRSIPAGVDPVEEDLDVAMVGHHLDVSA